MTELATDNEIQSFLGGVSRKRKRTRPRAGGRDCIKLCVSRNKEWLGLGHSSEGVILKRRIHLDFWKGLLWAQGQKTQLLLEGWFGALLPTQRRLSQRAWGQPRWCQAASQASRIIRRIWMETQQTDPTCLSFYTWVLIFLSPLTSFFRA